MSREEYAVIYDLLYATNRALAVGAGELATLKLFNVRSASASIRTLG